MKSAPFAYVRPATLPDALAALGQNDGMARALAGGQSLVPMLNLRLAPVDRIVDIRHLPELRRVEERADSIFYGALTTHAGFEDRAVPDGSNGLMPFIASRIAYRAVRNRGTIGGSLALADPAADWLPTVVALGATLHLVGPAGRRPVPAAEFVLGPYMTALDESELLEGIDVPKHAASARWGTSKVAVKTGEYAESLAIAVIDRTARTARIVLGAADGAPIRLERTAEYILSYRGLDRLAEIAGEELMGSGREFSPARLRMHVTTVTRAVRDAEAG
jgi:carbon-monoxide dehydrogenase medium subunit